MLISGTTAAEMAATALVMALTPGPNMMYLLSRSISQGRVAGWVSLAGTAAGFLIYMTMAHVGLAALFVTVPWLYVGFKAAGAIYLAYLAWQALLPGGRDVFEPPDVDRDSHLRLLLMGLITNLLNPKAALMYVALIPQFVDPAQGHTAQQGFELGGLQIVVSVSVNALLILVAGSVAQMLRGRPTWASIQRRITGTLLSTIAMLLAREVPARARI